MTEYQKSKIHYSLLGITNHNNSSRLSWTKIEIHSRKCEFCMIHLNQYLQTWIRKGINKNHLK